MYQYMLPVFNTCWMYWMAYTSEIHSKYHVFVVFMCFRQNRKSGGARQMYLPCIIVYFACIRGLDDVLTSNTSKYIQYIGPINSGCIGKIWKYWVYKYILNKFRLQFQYILSPEKLCIIQIQYISITSLSKQSLLAVHPSPMTWSRSSLSTADVASY